MMRCSYSRCGERDHGNGDRIDPVVIFIVGLKEERSLPLLLFVETLAECLEDRMCEEITLSNDGETAYDEAEK
jgi:hypothetical protein